MEKVDTTPKKKVKKVSIAKVSPEEIVLWNVSMAKMNLVAEICHEQKHLFKDGYRHGRKTRKKDGKPTKRWEGCPEICFTYLITDDFDEHKEFAEHAGFLRIEILVSDWENLMIRYSREQIEAYAYMFAMRIADNIKKRLDREAITTANAEADIVSESVL